MGSKANTSLFFTLLATVGFVLCFVTPWWWTKMPNTNKNTTNCFIDGTCRNGGLVFKDNGSAQKMYDWSLALMLFAFAFWLLFVHLVYAIRSPRYGSFQGRWWLTVASGGISIVLVVAACCCFGIGVPSRLGLGHLFGSKNLDDDKLKWGANVGWFIALLTLVPMILALMYISIKKTKRDTGYDYTLNRKGDALKRTKDEDKMNIKVTTPFGQSTYQATV